MGKIYTPDCHTKPCWNTGNANLVVEFAFYGLAKWTEQFLSIITALRAYELIDVCVTDYCCFVGNRACDITCAASVLPEVVAQDATGALFSQPQPLAGRLVRRWQPLSTVRLASLRVAQRIVHRTCLPSFLPGRIECFRLLQQARLPPRCSGRSAARWRRVETKEPAQIIRRLPAMRTSQRFPLLHCLPGQRLELRYDRT